MMIEFDQSRGFERGSVPAGVPQYVLDQICQAQQADEGLGIAQGESVIWPAPTAEDFYLFPGLDANQLSLADISSPAFKKQHQLPTAVLL